MQWKLTPDGQNIVAELLDNWLIARPTDEMMVFLLRHQGSDGQGKPRVADIQLALPVGLAELLATQILECARTGLPQEGRPTQTIQ